jgi:hypothetical protein
MGEALPSRTKILNFGLVTFLTVLPAMILLYKWAI